MPNNEIVLDFKHKQSAHCENGVVSNLLRYYGIELSEPMIFGIGSGMFFSHMPFVKVDGIPVTSFRPLPGIIFKRVSKRLGIQFERKRYKNPHKAMEALDEVITQNRPVGMLVGVYHLSYFPAPYRFHFNAHNLVAYGKKNGDYLISDPVMEGFEKLSYKELQRVRYAKGLFAPKGHMYYVKHIPENIDINGAIVKGIKKTCKDMLTIPVGMFGVKGIRFMAKKIAKYPDKLGTRKASLFAGQIVRAQEEIGTGGAGFRFMYAAFLQEAAGYMKQDWLKEMSVEMTKIGDMWRDFAATTARLVKMRENQGENYKQVSDLLMNIADAEEAFYKKLQKITL
jgi:hypothetical protein